MSLNDWLKSFFEGRKSEDPSLDDEIKQTVKEFDKFFELHDQEKRKKTLDDDEIRREFEKAHKEMEEVFRMWGGIHSQYQKQFPHHGPHQQWPPVLHPPHSEQFLQNKGDEEITYVPNMDIPHAHTQTRSKIFPWLHTDGYVLDTDVEKELEQSIAISDFGALSPIKPQPKEEPARKPSWFSHARPVGPGFHSNMQPGAGGSSSRVSVYTYSSSGGLGGEQRVEERRTVDYGEGKQETTVTRRIGDQSQTVVTKRKSDGSEELHETTVNLDKDEKASFDKRWNTPALSEGDQSDALTKPKSELGEAQKRSLFSNLFGSGFKGFPPSGRDED